MELDEQENEGQTPLDPDEKAGLLIGSISTRSELDEFEQQNIEQAIAWSMKRRWPSRTILTVEFLQLVHRKIFNEVWDWAGEFRTTNKNIGADHWLVSAKLQQLLDDAWYWLEHDTYSSDEFCLRFKHRLVSIHCFPNENGRHSRLVADIMSAQIFNMKVFSWGSSESEHKTDPRQAYLDVLHQADRHKLQPLISFARS